MQHDCKNGLLLEPAYNKTVPLIDNAANDENDDYSCFRHDRLIRDHLLYLNNPVQADKCIFPAFKRKAEGIFPIQIFRDGQMDESADWRVHYTSFDNEDLLSILSCLNVPLMHSVAQIMTSKFFEHATATTSVADPMNFRALKLPRNHLEIAVAAAIADASQHAFFDPSACFLNGLEGLTFLRNLLVNNVIEELNRQEVQLVFDPRCGLLEKLFKRIRVPFIYGINQESELLDRLSEEAAFDIFLASYSQADGLFNFKEYANELLTERADVREADDFPQLSAKNLHLFGVECKNVKNQLTVTKLHVAIQNLRANSVLL